MKKRKRSEINDGRDQSAKRGSLVEVNGNGPEAHMGSESFSDGSGGFNPGVPGQDDQTAAMSAMAFRQQLENVPNSMGGLGGSFDMVDQSHQQYPPLTPLTPYGNAPAAQVQAQDEQSPHGGASKPAVGTDEWHKVRRDNHKEGMYCQQIRLTFGFRDQNSVFVTSH